jgi:hypothetical protein
MTVDTSKGEEHFESISYTERSFEDCDNYSELSMQELAQNLPISFVGSEPNGSHSGRLSNRSCFSQRSNSGGASSFRLLSSRPYLDCNMETIAEDEESQESEEI